MHIDVFILYLSIKRKNADNGTTIFEKHAIQMMQYKKIPFYFDKSGGQNSNQNFHTVHFFCANVNWTSVAA